MTLKEIVLESAVLIELNGWTKGKLQDYFGCFCMWGAIEHIAHSRRSTLTKDERNYLTDSFYKFNNGCGMVYYNDYVAQTKGNVVTKLREFAEVL